MLAQRERERERVGEREKQEEETTAGDERRELAIKGPAAGTMAVRCKLGWSGVLAAD